MAFHEINGSRRYEYRYEDQGGITGWHDAGVASPTTLAQIEAGLVTNGMRDAAPSDDGVLMFEVRAVCQVADDEGVYVGTLMFSELVKRYEAD